MSIYRFALSWQGLHWPWPAIARQRGSPAHQTRAYREIDDDTLAHTASDGLSSDPCVFGTRDRYAVDFGDAHPFEEDIGLCITTNH